MDKNREMTKQTIDFVLAFCEKLRSEKDHWEHTGEKDIQDVAGGYITSKMLMGIYNILINEGYTKKHLDNFFFFDSESNKHKEWTKEACKLYLRGDPGYNKYTEEKKTEDFFYKTIRGIKLRKEIDKLSEKFNQ
ncbi:hypothetical protein ES705_30149 [subsurface metagenome]